MFHLNWGFSLLGTALILNIGGASAWTLPGDDLEFPQLHFEHRKRIADKFSGSGHLQKRDACSDAFGTGWIDSACTPGNTLCCECYSSDNSDNA